MLQYAILTGDKLEIKESINCGEVCLEDIKGASADVAEADSVIAFYTVDGSLIVDVLKSRDTVKVNIDSQFK